MNISKFFKLWNKDDVVKKVPLSFSNWLKQNQVELEVHIRTEPTFVTKEGIAFDLIPPVYPDTRTDVSVSLPHKPGRKASVQSVMDKYSAYLKDKFGIVHPGEYIHWADAPIINFDTKTA